MDAGAAIAGFTEGASGAPDVGPFELGQEIGPEWPRPRRRAFNANPPARIAGMELAPAMVLFDE